MRRGPGDGDGAAVPLPEPVPDSVSDPILDPVQDPVAQLSFLDSIIENIPAMVFVKEAADLRFVRFNRAGEELLGYDRSELLGKNDFALFPADEAEAFRAMDREVLRRGELIDVPEEPIVTRFRGTRILHTKKIPIRGRDGEPAYLLGISEDITEGRGNEQELRRAREEAVRANRAKSDFLSKMSHELRTPLNVILGFSQLILSEETSTETNDGASQILAAGRHLLDLINEILDISRIEAGKLALSVEPVELELIIREVLSLLAPLATARSVDLVVQPGDGRYVQADRQRLRQVLLNLVSNGVKYNKFGGEVRIEVRRVAGGLRLCVSDTGPGISEERLPLLFQPFERLGAEASGIEGTGLGLALSKGLTEAMGGSIGVNSRMGCGSTFWVELAEASEQVLDLVPPHPGDRWAAPSGRGHTVLYVEDNESNIRLVEHLMKRRGGITLRVSTHGRQALELAHAEPPDLILLDLNLPDMHGSAVLRVLRHSEATRHVPVVVVSADATAHQRRLLLGEGAAAYLTKPIDLEDFRRVVDQLLDGGTDAAGGR